VSGRLSMESRQQARSANRIIRAFAGEKATPGLRLLQQTLGQLPALVRASAIALCDPFALTVEQYRVLSGGQ
jgi:hypothetical protein